MKEAGNDITSHRSKHVDEFAGQEFDYVLTVCVNAKESCPVFFGKAARLHHSFNDPAGVEGSEEKRLALDVYCERDRHPQGPRLRPPRCGNQKREARGAPASRARSAPPRGFALKATPIKRAKLRVMGGKRALRRAHDRRMKDRARRVMKLMCGRRLWPPEPRKVGVNASTHCRPCGSSMCREDGRVPSPRERAFDYRDVP